MANLTDLNSLTKNPGSECPPLVEGKVRIYSMRFCPYAQRALLALAAKNIPTDVVNVNLKEKPDWFLARNPMGKVPTIEHGGKVIYESGVTVEYLDDVFPDTTPILPKDPYQRAHQKMLAERLTKLSSSIYGVLRKLEDAEALKAVDDAITHCESLLEGQFYGGESPSWADYMIWPWMERSECVALLSKGKIQISQDNHPKMHDYIERMKLLPEIQACYRNPEVHAKFFEHIVAGEHLAGYDLGIEK